MVSIVSNENDLLAELIAWLRKRGEPDSGIDYEGVTYNYDEGLGRSRRDARVVLHGADATFIADHFHGQGARDLAEALTAAFSPPSNLQNLQNAPAPSSLVPVEAVGWKLVPIEPTPEMLKAGMDDLGWWVEPYTAPRESGVPVDNDMSEADAASINAMQIATVADTYRAMLSAAPAHREVGE